MANLQAARDILGDSTWDEGPTVSVHLPADIARFFLKARGWRHEGAGYWTAPDGARFWELDEALQLAIAAEVL